MHPVLIMRASPSLLRSHEATTCVQCAPSASPTRSDGAANAGTLGISPASAGQPTSVPISNLALFEVQGLSKYRDRGTAPDKTHFVSASRVHADGPAWPSIRRCVNVALHVCYRYIIVADLLRFIHLGALVNDDNNDEQPRRHEKLRPQLRGRVGGRGEDGGEVSVAPLGSAAFHAPLDQTSLKAHCSSGLI